MSTHHMLDIAPIPEKVLYLNEPWLIDVSFDGMEKVSEEPDPNPDNVRVYLPLDLNAEAILRRLRYVVYRYGEANEANESNYRADVNRLVSQIEIYDQVRRIRDGDMTVGKDGRIRGHSRKAIQLVREFIGILEQSPDGCAELFHFELIDELKEDYLTGASE